MTNGARIGLLIILILSGLFLIYRLTQNAVLLDSIKNLDASAAVDAIRSYTIAELVVGSIAVLAVTGSAIAVYKMKPGELTGAIKAEAKMFEGAAYDSSPAYTPSPADNLQTAPFSKE